jgi:tetratricopeptide (TPR) repeat protein
MRIWACLLLYLSTLIFVVGQSAQTKVSVEQEINVLLNQTIEMETKGEPVKSFEYLAKAIVLSENLDSTNLLSLELQMRLAEKLYSLNARKEAIHKLKRAIQLFNPAEKQGIMIEIHALGMLAGWYTEVGSYDSALYCLKQGLSLSIRFEEGSIISQYNNIGFLYAKAGDDKQALSYYFLAFRKLNEQQNPDQNLLYSILDNIGEIYLGQKKFELAFRYFNQANQLGLKMNNHFFRRTQSHLQFARTFLASGRYTEAEQNLKIAEREIPTLDVHTKQKFRLILNDLWIQLYKSTGRFREALIYQENKERLKENAALKSEGLLEKMMDLLATQEIKWIHGQLKLEQETRQRHEQELVIRKQRARFSQAVMIGIGTLGVLAFIWTILYIRSNLPLPNSKMSKWNR